jgi:hypothetical protein
MHAPDGTNGLAEGRDERTIRVGLLDLVEQTQPETPLKGWG